MVDKRICLNCKDSFSQQVDQMSLLCQVVFGILYHHVGQANAIGRVDLLCSVQRHVQHHASEQGAYCPFAGLHDRRLRQVIHALRRIGVLICSGGKQTESSHTVAGHTVAGHSWSGGYWIAGTREEAEQFLTGELKKRAKDLLVTYRVLQRSAREQFGVQTKFTFAAQDQAVAGRPWGSGY